MNYYLVLDLGTTYFKACLFDDTGHVCGLQRSPLSIDSTEPGRCELSTQSLRECIVDLLRRLREEAPDAYSDVCAITFATQTNSFVLLDADNAPLTPIILWPDARARDSVDVTDAIARFDTRYSATGVPALTHEFMAAKLAWFRAHQPEILERANRVHLISDYFTLWMTGEHVSEAGAAGLTGLLDIHSLEWRTDALHGLGLDEAWFPPVVRAGTDLGPILPDVAGGLGLPAHCRFVVGCLDQYAGAIGAGNVVAGAVSETTGTVLATVRCADAFNANPAPGVFQGPGFADGMYYQMAFGDTSANLLEAYRNGLSDRPSFSELDEAAAAIAPGADGVRLAHDADKAITDRFLGWREEHTRGHAVRAILEAVAYALADQLDAVCGNSEPDMIRSVGGAARSRLWLQIKADVLNRRIAAIDCPEPTSLGAAILAMQSLTGSNVAECTRATVRIKEIVSPDTSAHEMYCKLRTS